MTTLTETYKIEPQEACIVIPSYIMAGLTIRYNPNTKILKITKQTK